MKWTSKRGSWRGGLKEKKKVLKVTAGFAPSHFSPWLPVRVLAWCRPFLQPPQKPFTLRQGDNFADSATNIRRCGPFIAPYAKYP